jgi:ribonuclease Z
VTHTHIDHFIGFDTLLRAALRREVPLNIYGPPNLTRCVAGKLKGYTWNLIKEYPLVINVFAYNGKTLAHSMFMAKNRFRRQLVSLTDSDGTLLEDPMFKVKAAKLSHGTPCLAYSIDENFHINIDKDQVMKKGLEIGPWLGIFKKALRENAPAGTTLEISGRRYRMDQLLDIAKITEGQKITFATDVAMTGKNIARLVELAKGSDALYCEAYFLEKDRERAKERFHLTAKTCGLIAKMAGVKKLFVTHISPKYMDCPDSVIREAMEAFRG